MTNSPIELIVVVHSNVSQVDAVLLSELTAGIIGGTRLFKSVVIVTIRKPAISHFSQAVDEPRRRYYLRTAYKLARSRRHHFGPKLFRIFTPIGGLLEKNLQRVKSNLTNRQCVLSRYKIGPPTMNSMFTFEKNCNQLYLHCAFIFLISYVYIWFYRQR